MSYGPKRGQFPSSWPAKDVPDVAWTYWSLVDSMSQHPGMVGLDDHRSRLHAALCAAYGMTREQTLIVTDHMDRYETAVEMDLALRAILAKEGKG